MTILFTLTLLLIVFMYLLTTYVWRQCPFLLEFGVFILAFVLGFALLFIPLNHAVITSAILDFESTKRSVETARTNKASISNLELAALQHKIIEQNAGLAVVQYWNDTMFDIWIPDSVDELDPIK